MMIVDNEFEFEQIVYLKTDRDQLPRIVTIMQIQKGAVMYGLSCGSQFAYHYDFEMSAEPNQLMKTI